MYVMAEKTLLLLLRSMTAPSLWDIRARFTAPQTRELILETIYKQIEALDQAFKNNPHGLMNLLMIISKLKTPMTREALAGFKYEQLAPASYKIDISNKIGYILGTRLVEYAHLAIKSPDMFLQDPSEFLQTLVDCCDAHPSLSIVAAKPVLNAITEQSRLVTLGADSDEQEPVKMMNQILADIAERGIDGAILALDDSHGHDGHARLLGCRYNLERFGSRYLIRHPEHSQTADLAKMISILDDVTIEVLPNNQLSVALSSNASAEDCLFVQNNLTAITNLIQNNDAKPMEDDAQPLSMEIKKREEKTLSLN